MSVSLLRSTRLFPDAPYAYAARAHHSDLIFTAGACPLDEQGQVTAPDDVAGQMSQALENLRIALEESGVTIRDVVHTEVSDRPGRTGPRPWLHVTARRTAGGRRAR